MNRWNGVCVDCGSSSLLLARLAKHLATLVLNSGILLSIEAGTAHSHRRRVRSSVVPRGSPIVGFRLRLLLSGPWLLNQSLIAGQVQGGLGLRCSLLLRGRGHSLLRLLSNRRAGLRIGFLISSLGGLLVLVRVACRSGLIGSCVTILEVVLLKSLLFSPQSLMVVGVDITLNESLVDWFQHLLL